MQYALYSMKYDTFLLCHARIWRVGVRKKREGERIKFNDIFVDERNINVVYLW